ncbi:MAG: helix-turn-helix domain-containing protein [Halomonas sp.]|uniref:Helix-turn-helix domain-containing protein n=1 Tax=Halomonas sulfidivorans TaxID=2733488 RepID=A0ABX7WEJ6_9GAMM|nr:helix-turn-helix domain-containing protein [Halomonas sulfidivorans]MDX5378950.1 helix-turn-helix domain-containing protein [Halomonas sp.]MDX5504036.1 helix-turn-helix domain-containing protein [Halomonas sp.]QTP58818.1 helix-turn-helix domain-containing protein [Halomonas sulfidivorans]
MDSDIEADEPLTIALLATPEATASTLYGMYDLFGSAGRDWGLLIHGQMGRPLLRPLIVSQSGEGFRAPNGAWIQPDSRLDACPPLTAACIPDLFIAPDERLTGRYDAEIAWLRGLHAQGTLLAAACTGAMLLAEAGMLAGQEATTHWAYCDALARRYPEVQVHPHRILVTSGEGQRLIMAGGGTSWFDLALYLVARLLGTDEAMRLARVHLIDWHRDGQQPYAVLNSSRQVEDACIARCQVWLAQHYDSHSPVAGMVEVSRLSERAFKRRFKAATGMTPMDYVHTLRLEEAKQLLEQDDEPIEAIAEQLGYADPSFFRRLFGRRVGLTPSQYRRRFRGLRLRLS